MKQRIQETKITSQSFVYKIYILLIAARHHHPSWKQGNCEAPLHLQHPQGVQGVPGAPPQLQELVHCHHHLLLHPPLLVLLGCQPEPDLDLLLHWHPHLLLRGTHRHVHPVGKSHFLWPREWRGRRMPLRNAPCIENRGIEDNFIFYIECYFFFYSCKEIQVWI